MSRSIVPNVRTMIAATILSMPFTANPTVAAETIMPSRSGAPGSMWVMQDYESKTLSKLHFINGQEIRAAQLGRNKAVRDDVREFAAMLERDYRFANEKVVRLARSLERPLLNPLPETVQERLEVQKMQAIMQNLEMIAPESFDEPFLKAMEISHAQAIASLEAALPRLSGSATASLIESLLPSLRVHLDRARLLQSGPRY